jgi:hypothetical protein
LVNQNNSPIVLTALVRVQAGQITDFIEIYAGMGPYEQMNIYGFYCRIEDGDFNMGDIDDDGNDETTFTDIHNLYLTSRDDEFAALPLCCNPRPGMGEALDMYLYRGTHPALRGNFISLALFNNNTTEISCGADTPSDCPQHTGKSLVFREPLSVYPSEQFRIKVRNNNTVPEDELDDDTYSQVRISFFGEIINKKQTLAILEGASERDL